MATQFSFRRPLTSYEKVRRLIAFVQRRRRSQFRRRDLLLKSYLDLGCGPNPHEDFINLDFRWAPHVDISWDIMRGLPFGSETMGGIFSEHCLEHLPLVSVPGLLRECHRILKPGGTIRVIVPDAELYIRRYVEIADGNNDVKLPYAEGDSFEGSYSPILSVNRIFRGHGHQFLYDASFITLLLARAGFVDVKKASFRSGRDPKLLIDTPSRAIESLYVEGTKG